ncbi:MAG TPA: hypothetical protein VFJ17_05130 [Mycobacteriales bacterium]|jgi:hypothetical protein|nr:hypothetical protein [Mycobacteriales bacterium]
MHQDDARRRMMTTALAQDPSLEMPVAERLLDSCLQILRDCPAADAAEVARRCVVLHPDADASWVAHLARAATAGRDGTGRS